MTYNEKINEKGTMDIVTQKRKDKDGRIVKACVFIPDNKVDELNAKKGWRLPQGGMLVLRGGVPCLLMEMNGASYTGRVLRGDYSTQSSRGRRLNDKLCEGVEDYLRAHGAVASYDVSDAMTPMSDNYKNTTEYTIDDLLDM